METYGSPRAEESESGVDGIEPKSGRKPEPDSASDCEVKIVCEKSANLMCSPIFYQTGRTGEDHVSPIEVSTQAFLETNVSLGERIKERSFLCKTRVFKETSQII